MRLPRCGFPRAARRGTVGGRSRESKSYAGAAQRQRKASQAGLALPETHNLPAPEVGEQTAHVSVGGAGCSNPPMLQDAAAWIGTQQMSPVG